MRSTPISQEHQKEILGHLHGEREINSVNVGQSERWLSSIVGGALAIYGIVRLATRPGWGGAGLATLGGAAIYRGATGHSFLYQSLDIVTVEQSPSTISELPGGRGIRIRRRMTIRRTPEELYNFWRDVEKAPLFMENIESVVATGERTSRWTAKGPLGKTVSWNSELLQDIPNQRISWHVHGTSIAGNAGSVNFEVDLGGHGTVVTLESDFLQWKGTLGKSAGKIVAHQPEQIVQKNLHQFKELMETGEIATTKGQPTGNGRK